MFRGDLRGAPRSKQCVGKFLAVVGFREPPRGGINQGKACHRGKARFKVITGLEGESAFGLSRPAGRVRIKSRSDLLFLGLDRRAAARVRSGSEGSGDE